MKNGVITYLKIYLYFKIVNDPLKQTKEPFNLRPQNRTIHQPRHICQ